MLVTRIVYAEEYISCGKQDLKSDYREQDSFSPSFDVH